MARRRRSSANKKRDVPRRYWLGLIALSLVILATGVAFLMYRRTLERQDPLADRIARIKPATMTVTSLRLNVPADDRDGLIWIQKNLVIEHKDNTAIAWEAARLWALRVAGSYGTTVAESASPVRHIFLDQQGVAYVDFAPWFVSSLNLGTATEHELQTSLEQTLEANDPDIRSLVVLCDGAPLATWGGHLGLHMGYHR